LYESILKWILAIIAIIILIDVLTFLDFSNIKAKPDIARIIYLESIDLALVNAIFLKKLE
jgi:hypothetical protein